MGSVRKQSVVPLGLALQGAVLFVAAAILNPVSTPSESAGTAGGGNVTQSADGLTSTSELPRDLQREQLPTPRFPKREKPSEPPRPKADDGAPPAPSSNETAKLASLRVQHVAFTTPLARAIAAPLPSAPTSLEGRSLAGGSWLVGRSRGRRGGLAGRLHRSVAVAVWAEASAVAAVAVAAAVATARPAADASSSSPLASLEKSGTVPDFLATLSEGPEYPRFRTRPRIPPRAALIYWFPSPNGSREPDRASRSL